MLLRLLRGEPLGMVVPQEIVQKVKRLLRHEVLVLLRDVLVPRLTRMFAQYAVEVMIEFDGISAPVKKSLDRHLQTVQNSATKMTSGQERCWME